MKSSPIVTLMVCYYRFPKSLVKARPVDLLETTISLNLFDI